jgi:hypothetical protein
MAHQLDWVEPYLKNQLAEAEKLAGTGTKEKQESILKVLSLFEARNSKTKTEENETEVNPDQGATETETIPPKTDDPASSEDKAYAIVEVLKESEVLKQDFDGAVQLVITKIACSYVESQPTGDGNLSVDIEAPKTQTDEQELEGVAVKGTDKNELANQGETGA